MKNNKLKLLLMIAVMLISADAFSAEDEAARAAHVRAAIELHTFVTDAAAHDAGGRDFAALFGADARDIAAARAAGLTAEQFAVMADAADKAVHVRAVIERYSE